MRKRRSGGCRKETIEPYLNSFINYERYRYFPKKVDLNDFKDFLKLIGNPQADLSSSILIAGTNGKGSVAAILSSVLIHAGYRTGLYTSPHIFSYRERIKVNGKAISKKSFKRCINSLRLHLDNPYQKKRRTFFEVLTTVAFLYFGDKKTDINIFEVGLGGRLDATNVVEPIVSVITSIGFDHTGTLGKTLSDITGEKCGIVRRKGVVVSSKQHKNAMNTIEKIAAKKDVYLLSASDTRLKPHSIDDRGIRFTYQGKQYFTPLKGKFQLENVRTALTVLKAIDKKNFSVSKKSIEQGFVNCSWRGRFEIISRKPFIILDGAHNPSAMKEIVNAVKEIYPQKKITVVFSCLRQKDKKAMANILESFAERIIVTRIDSPRATGIRELEGVFRRKVYASDNIKDAITLARRFLNGDTLLLITGSIYLVSEALCAFDRI